MSKYTIVISADSAVVDVSVGDAPFATPNPTPTIASLTPTAIPQGSPGAGVSILGTGYVTGKSVVSDATTALYSGVVDATHMTAILSAAKLTTPGPLSLRVTNPGPVGGDSNVAIFNVVAVAPDVSSVAPSGSLINSPDSTIVVTGSGFLAGYSSLRIDGTPVACTVGSFTQITGTVPASLKTAGGTRAVTVTNAPGNGYGASATYTVGYPVPGAVSITPNVVAPLSGNTPVAILATGLIPGITQMFLGATQVPLTVVTSTTATATVPSSLLAATQNLAFTLFNPTPGGGTSNALTLAVLNYPVPAISGMTPSRILEGSGDTPVTITGTGFVQGVSVVKAGATTIASTWVSSTSMTTMLTAAQLAAATTYGITVTNPTPGGGASAPSTFTVVAHILWDTGDLAALLSVGQISAVTLANYGLAFSRASTATIFNSAASNLIDASVNPDVARVQNLGAGVKGLLFEESSVNGQYYASQLGNWGVAGTTPATIGALVTADAAVAPDGTTTADRVLCTATGGLLFTSAGPSFTSAGGIVTNSIFLKHGAGSNGSIQGVCSFNGGGIFNSDGTIKTWKRYASASYTSTGVTCNSCLQVISPNIPDVYVWGSQCEPKAFPTSYIVQTNNVLATRAGERLFRLLAPILDGGRLGLHLRFRPLGSSSEQTGNVRLFTTTTGDYAEVNKTTRVLTVSIASVVVTLGALPTWARGDELEIFLACGGGTLTTTASCRVNGGSTVNLSFAAAQGTVTGVNIDILCNGTTQQFSCDYAQSLAYAAGVKPAWATSAGSVVTTTTSSMTLSSGTRWQNGVSGVTIRGAGFTPQSAVQIDGATIPSITNYDGSTTPGFAYVNATTMTANIPDTAFWTTGTRAVTVIDQFGAASNPQNIAVTYEAAITSHSRNDASSITTATGVSQVLDATGNARPLAQAAGAKQPTAVAAGLNGRTTWRADGVDDRLATPNFAVPQPCGFVAVLKALTWVNGKYVIDGAVTGNQFALGQIGVTPQHQLFAGSAFAAANAQIPLGAWRTVHGKAVAGTGTIQVNWAPGTTGAVGANGLAGIGFGGSGADSGFANVEGAELLTYNAATISAATLANYARELESVHGGVVAKRRNVVMIGDSLTAGTAVATANQRYVPLLAARPEFANGSWTFTNVGVSGRGIADLVAAYATEVQPLYDPTATNIAVVLIGTNGLGQVNSYSQVVPYLATLRGQGWLVVTCTVPAFLAATQTNDINRTPYNASLRTDWQTNGVAICDLAADPRIGPMAASYDTTYYVDAVPPNAGTHWNYQGNLVVVGIVAPVLARVGY